MEKEIKQELKKISLRAEKKKWECIQKSKKPRFYFFYLVLILSMAYVIDEIATNINAAIQSDAVTTFFDGNVNQYTIIMTIAATISSVAFLVRSLADRFGRKPFLIINLFGMGVGMLICFLARSLPYYLIGLGINFLFAPFDIQTLYIIEVSSDKRRAMNLSICKAVGMLGITIVPILKNALRIFGWQDAFFVPALLGIAMGIIVIFFVRESDVFISDRINQIKLELRKKPTKNKKKKKTKKNESTSLIEAIKYMFKEKAFLWLCLASVLFGICSIGMSNYSLVMTPTVEGAITYIESDSAIALYPFACALIIIANGIISDAFGRRVATIFDSAVAFLGIVFFFIGVTCSWHYALVGVFLGSFIGGYLSGVDTFNVLCSEKSPTMYRSSIMSIINVAVAVGTTISTLIFMLFNTVIENLNIGILIIVVIPISLAGALYVLLLKVPETKGMALDQNDIKVADNDDEELVLTTKDF